MATYRITNTTSGLTIGDYTADSAEEAGVAMLRDAGYPGATAEDIDNDVEIVEVLEDNRGWDCEYNRGWDCAKGGHRFFGPDDTHCHECGDFVGACE